MFLTLSQLRDFVNEKISEQGEDAPSVSYIFTREDIKDEDGEIMKDISNSYATEVLEYFDGVSDHYREKLEDEMGDCISMCDPEVKEDLRNNPNIKAIFYITG